MEEKSSQYLQIWCSKKKNILISQGSQKLLLGVQKFKIWKSPGNLPQKIEGFTTSTIDVNQGYFWLQIDF